VSVTVTVNVPADKLLIVAVVAPLLQEKVTFDAVAVADPFGLVQLVLSILPQVTVGFVVLLATIA